MSGDCLLLRREPLLESGELCRIEEAMFRVLETAGIAVLDDALRERLKGLGFRVRGGRVLIERSRVAEFLDAERTRNGHEYAKGPREVDRSDTSIRLYVNTYPQHVHDIESDRVAPFTSERLIEATKIMDVVSGLGIVGSVPGCPSDVPPELQPVVQYWIGATYSRNGRKPTDVKTLRHCGYMMEMAELLGHPIRHLPVWVASPLTLGGESLECVMEFQDRLSSIFVGSMPSVGSTAPMNAGDGFAVSAAEIVGSAVLLTAVVGLPVRWAVSLFPTDFESMAMVFGSPENTTLAMMGSEVDAYLHGTRWSPGGGSALTMAKLPGPQACAEKASAMTVGALLGKRVFAAPGALSLDEVFSPEQLLYDLEVKAHVEGMLRGLKVDCDPARCLSEVLETLSQRSFAGLESTARACHGFWRPALFERSFLSTWQTRGEPSIRRRAQAMVRELVSQHEYELDSDTQRELDRILAHARAALS